MKKVKDISKKIIIIIAIICLLLSLFSCDNISYAATKTQIGNTIAEFSINFFNEYAKETKYSTNFSYRQKAYNGEKVDGYYQMDCVGWINFAVHQSVGLDTGDKGYSQGFGVPPGNNTTGFHYGFELVEGNEAGGSTISKTKIKETAQPGDILFKNGQHVLIYVGDGKVIHSTGHGPHRGDDKGYGLSYDSIDDLSYEFCAIGRITESAASSINESNCTTMFNEVTGAADDYGQYYGTTTASYAGSYTLGQWLFDKFVGFFDYLAGILTYVFRMQFLGWGNIIEELVNYAIKDATGVETVAVDKSEESTGETEEGSEYTPGTGNLYTPTATNSTNTVWSNDRLNIEDIIYNRVPLLDINFLDVNLDRYKKIEEAKKAKASEGEEIEVISEDSIVYSLRANIAKWYIVIRQICIIVLLLLLIYLGIRLAISTTAGDKAKYKGMLWAWFASFVVVFCIHYYMMIVIDINEILVDIFAEVSENAIENSDNGTGSQSIYDTMRTRAYSLKLSEGFPATIFYLVLIYFLVRFLFIYIKRYFTIMILALMGPIMSIKNCFDKISTGRSKSMSKWMYDFALNVFLQTIHAILYCMFMVIAFDLATNSVVGFVMALIVLNFIFKAEKIFMNIFNFEGRASSLRDVNENKNYFAEAYKVGMGVTMFGGTALKFGVGVVAGSGKFLGTKALSSAQIGVSAFRRLKGDTPIDLSEKFSDRKENIKNGMADRLNSVIEGVTGERSLRLDLHNIKKQDPELYEKTKDALKLKKDLKWKTLKRTFGDSTKSIRYMAELVMGVPMLVIDTQSGMSTLMDATGGLRGMSERDKGYGYKRKINGRKGNFARNALNAATFGGVNATINNAEKFNKERKKLVKNNKLIGDLNKANILELKIQKEVDKMIQDGKKDDIDNIMKDAMNQVMNASKIKEAVSRYMAMKGITNVTEADLNIIVNKINSEIFTGNVDKVINKYVKKGKVEQLDINDIDEILNIIGEKVESGVSEVINDKQNRDTDNTKVKDKVNKYMKEQGVDKIDVDKARELLKSEEAQSDFGIETVDEVKRSIASKFAGKKSDKTLDKKQAVTAIEDAILAGTVGTKEEPETDLGKMMRELATLKEKTKVSKGKEIVDLREFTKVIKDKFK